MVQRSASSKRKMPVRLRLPASSFAQQPAWRASPRDPIQAPPSSRAPTHGSHRNSRHMKCEVTRRVQTAVPPSVISASLAARRPTIRVARATFRPARLAFRAVRRTARRAFRIAFRPARRILRASRRPVRRDCRADRRPARLVRRVARLACLFLRGMFSSLTTMCQMRQLTCCKCNCERD